MSSSKAPRRRRSSSGKKRSKYHKLAFRNKLGSILEDHAEDTEEEQESTPSFKSITKPGRRSERHRLVHEAKIAIVCELARTGGDSSSASIQQSLHKLSANYDSAHFDPRASPPRPDAFVFCGPQATRMEGTWMTLSKPNFSGCLGTNDAGDYLYTLGRMAFGMFQPTQLVCSIQGTFNVIGLVDGSDDAAMKNVPASLKADARYGSVPVRSYNIITAFTIEPGQPGDTGPNASIDEPIESIMTTYGYCLPYPTGNRFSVWFTGGSIEVSGDVDRWHKVFSKESLPGRTISEKSKLFAAKLFMGAETNDEMDADGRISYQLTRPVAANIDLLYVDEAVRILRGNSGAVYVFGRVQNVEDVTSEEDEEETRFSSRVRSLGDATVRSSRNAAQPRRPTRRGSPVGARAPALHVRRNSGRSSHNELKPPVRRNSPTSPSPGSPPRQSVRVVNSPSSSLMKTVEDESSSAPPQAPVRRFNLDSPTKPRSITPAFIMPPPAVEV